MPSSATEPPGRGLRRLDVDDHLRALRTRRDRRCRAGVHRRSPRLRPRRVVRGTPRDRSTARLDDHDQVYLDYTGGGLHAASQIDAHAELLRTRVLGNPHSNNPTSLATTELVERARQRGARLLRRVARRVPLRLHRQRQRGAAAGRRGLPVRPRRHVRADLRQPQLGQRHPRVRPSSRVPSWPTCPSSPPSCASTRTALRAALDRADPGAHNLFAFPAQSNFSGVQHPLDLVDEAHDRGWDVLLDAAAFVPTNRLDLSVVRPDFVTLSFYKMFGFPTGVGCLLIRKDRRVGTGAAVVRRRHHHHLLGAGRRPLPPRRRSRLRGRHRRLPQPAGGGRPASPTSNASAATVCTPGSSASPRGCSTR